MNFKLSISGKHCCFLSAVGYDAENVNDKPVYLTK